MSILDPSDKRYRDAETLYRHSLMLDEQGLDHLIWPLWGIDPADGEAWSKLWVILDDVLGREAEWQIWSGEAKQDGQA